MRLLWRASPLDGALAEVHIGRILVPGVLVPIKKNSRGKKKAIRKWGGGGQNQNKKGEKGREKRIKKRGGSKKKTIGGRGGGGVETLLFPKNKGRKQ